MCAVKARYFLTDDEELNVGYTFSYRVRIWRREALPLVNHAVVLTEPTNGSPPVDLHSVNLANRVNRELLGFADTKRTWFEHSIFEGFDRAFCVTWKVLGHTLRPMLAEPAYSPVDWFKLQQTLKENEVGVEVPKEVATFTAYPWRTVGG